ADSRPQTTYTDTGRGDHEPQYLRHVGFGRDAAAGGRCGPGAARRNAAHRSNGGAEVQRASGGSVRPLPGVAQALVVALVAPGEGRLEAIPPDDLVERARRLRHVDERLDVE